MFMSNPLMTSLSPSSSSLSSSSSNSSPDETCASSLTSKVMLSISRIFRTRSIVAPSKGTFRISFSPPACSISTTSSIYLVIHSSFDSMSSNGRATIFEFVYSPTSSYTSHKLNYSSFSDANGSFSLYDQAVPSLPLVNFFNNEINIVLP